jgi:hypothetical protein
MLFPIIAIGQTNTIENQISSLENLYVEEVAKNVELTAKVKALSQKIETLNDGTNKLSIIGKFTIRRALRIFPIYYILLIVLILSRSILPNPVMQDWYYYALYIQNYLYYFRDAFPGGKLSHMWSLAVEEQFYLFWPWIIVFNNKKHLLKVL